MATNLIYGVVVDGTFYSNRIERKAEGKVDNGIYSVNMDVDDFWSTLELANIVDAVAFFRKASRIRVLRGVSFHNGMIPDNPVAFAKIPLEVKDGQFEEFEYVEAAILKDKVNYFIQTLATNESYALMDLKTCFDKNGDVTKLKNLTPPMRIVYGFHMLEKKRKEEQEPVNAITSRMTASGAEVVSIRPDRLTKGFEVIWKLMGHTINTLLDKNFRVIEAGFCVSGYDRTQSASSLPNLLKTYRKEGSHIHILRYRD
jgi:hypothetical protein